VTAFVDLLKYTHNNVVCEDSGPFFYLVCAEWDAFLVVLYY